MNLTENELSAKSIDKALANQYGSLKKDNDRQLFGLTFWISYEHSIIDECGSDTGSEYVHSFLITVILL